MEFRSEDLAAEVEMYVKDSQRAPGENAWVGHDCLVACARARQAEVDNMLRRLERLTEKHS